MIMLINGHIIHNELLTRWCKAPVRVKVCVTNYQPSCTLNGHHPSPSSSPRWCRSWRTRSYLILNHFLNFPFNWVNTKVLHDGIRINENCNNEIMSMMICIFLRFRIYHHSLKRCVFTLTNRRGCARRRWNNWNQGRSISFWFRQNQLYPVDRSDWRVYSVRCRPSPSSVLTRLTACHSGRTTSVLLISAFARSRWFLVFYNPHLD